MMTRLKINFHKSCVYNLSRCEEMNMRVTSILNCNLGILPFTYLRLPIKVATLTREDWPPFAEKIEKRLATWKGSTPSRGERLILVNLVLSSLPPGMGNS